MINTVHCLSAIYLGLETFGPLCIHSIVMFYAGPCDDLVRIVRPHGRHITFPVRLADNDVLDMWWAEKFTEFNRTNRKSLAATVQLLVNSAITSYAVRWSAEFGDTNRSKYLPSMIYRVAQKWGHRPSYLIRNIPKTPWPNCMEIGGLLQYYMLNTVIDVLFKNFIALWRHLAKTPLLSFIHTVQIDLSITQ